MASGVNEKFPLRHMIELRGNVFSKLMTPGAPKDFLIQMKIFRANSRIPCQIQLSYKTE
jgi:hypothetical protein